MEILGYIKEKLKDSRLNQNNEKIKRYFSFKRNDKRKR